VSSITLVSGATIWSSLPDNSSVIIYDHNIVMTDTLAYFPEMKIDDGKMFDGPRVTRLGEFLTFGYFLLGYFLNFT